MNTLPRAEAERLARNLMPVEMFATAMSFSERTKYRDTVAAAFQAQYAAGFRAGMEQQSRAEPHTTETLGPVASKDVAKFIANWPDLDDTTRRMVVNTLTEQLAEAKALLAKVPHETDSYGDCEPYCFTCEIERWLEANK